MLITSFLMGIALGANCGKMTVRKEASDVSDSEWRMIVDTIQKAQLKPEEGDPDGYSVWEAGADLHRDVADPNAKARVHNSCMFFFWHRMFLIEMEKSLQEINPDFFFPYWDSPKEWGTIDASPVWKHLGGRGTPVPNDIFNGEGFKLKQNRKQLGRTSRSLNESLVPSEVYDNMLADNLKTNGGYAQWHTDAEITHGSVHIAIGGLQGQMSMMASPLDPLFYLHHGHFDYLWLQAQVQWNAKGLTQFGGEKAEGGQCRKSDIVTGYNVTLEEAVELKNFCVEYAQPTVLDLPDELPSTTIDIPATTTSSNESPTITTELISTITRVTDAAAVTDDSAAMISETTISTTTDSEDCSSSSSLCSSGAKPTEIVKNPRRRKDTTGTLFVKPPLDLIHYSPPIQTPASEVDHLCPEPATDEWLKMQGGSLKELRKKYDMADENCKKLVKEIKKGKKIKPVPEVVESCRAPVAPVHPTPLVPKSDRSKKRKGKSTAGKKASKGKSGKSEHKPKKSHKNKKERSAKEKVKGGKNKKAKGSKVNERGYAESENGSKMLATPIIASFIVILILAL